MGKLSGLADFKGNWKGTRETRHTSTKYQRSKLEGKSRIEIDFDIADTIEIKRLNWYGQMQRINYDRLPKKVWVWTAKNRRKRGWPRKR